MANKSAKKLTVVTNNDPRLGAPISSIKWPDGRETPVEPVVNAITEIAAAMRSITNSRLRRDALVTLISARSHICKRDVEIVLNNLDCLENLFLNPKIAHTDAGK